MKEVTVSAQERVEGIQGMCKADPLECLPDPVILAAVCSPPALKQLGILEGMRQRQTDEHHPGVEGALKGFIDVEILLRAGIDEP
jgi:hypothetical protein